MICREDGIRTHDAVTHILAFQASSFNHSDTSLFGVAKNHKIFEEKKRIIAYCISPLKEVSKIVLKTDGATF